MAKHIVGGELFYTYAGIDNVTLEKNYYVTLKVYRDCFPGNTAFDATANVSIFSGAGVFIKSISIGNPSIQQLQNTNYPCATNVSVCIDEAIYESTISLPDNNTGYHLSYQRCCRNNTIINLLDPGFQGLTITTYIPAINVVAVNSSPRFTNVPPVFLCLGKSLTYNHIATDPDGDRLTYEICSPLNGSSQANPRPEGIEVPPPPYANVQFDTPFSTSNPILSVLPLSINETTGILKCTPTAFGQYVFAICVSEWRDGVKINTTRRDFQFNVTACQFPDAIISSSGLSPNNVTSDSVLVLCNGNTVYFNNGSLYANGFNWDFGVTNITSDVSSSFASQYTYTDTGEYKIRLIAYKTNFNCADTAYVKINVQKPFSPFIFCPKTTQCIVGNNFSFKTLGIFDSTICKLNWDFSVNTNTQFDSVINPSNIIFNTPGYFQIYLNGIQNRCTKKDFINLTVAAEPVFSSISKIMPCTGLKHKYSFFGSSVTTVKWDFLINNPTNPLLNGETVNYTSLDSGILPIKIFINNLNVCFDTVIQYVRLTPELKLSISNIGNVCEDDNEIVVRKDVGLYHLNGTYNWTYLEGNLLQNNDSIIKLKYVQAGNYVVYLTFRNFGCEANALTNLQIFKNPKATYRLLPNEGCIPHTVNFIDSVITENAFTYDWNLGNNFNSNMKNPTVTFNDTGTFFSNLVIITTNGCKDTVTFENTTPIYARPIPKADFETDSIEKYFFFNSTIKVKNTSIKPYSKVSYDWGVYPKIISNLEEDTFSYKAPGDYTIYQIVENQYGCKDSTRRYVYISDNAHLYLPNAFTPNNDLLNDAFYPKYFGLSDVSFEIYNKWGVKLFSSTNGVKAWDGYYQGVLCMPDTYTCIVNFLDRYNVKRKKTGIVNLIN